MAQQLDLTEGVIWKKLLRFSVPIILSSMLQAAYSLADTIIAGQFIGTGGISAINNAGQITHIVTQVIIGITTGGNILMSQYFGAKQHEDRKRAGITLFLVSMLLGVICVAFFRIFSRKMLELIGCPALDQAEAYLNICSYGILAIFGYNCMSAMIRAVGNSRLPLVCVAVTAILNVVLDIAFVGYMDMGTGGAALATIIAQYASFFVSLGYALKTPELYGFSLNALRIDREKLLRMTKLGIPCAIQMTAAGLSWLTVTFLVNGHGLEASAASGINARIKDFCQLFSVGMSSAAATMIAQCVGAKLFDRGRRVLYTAMSWAVCVSIVIIAFVQVAAPYLVTIFTDDPLTIKYAVMNLRIEIIGQLFYASFLVYHALALGAGNTLYVLGSSLLNCVAVRLVLALIFDHFWGLEGIYWACLIAPSSSVFLGIWYERSGFWMRQLKK